MSKTIQQKNQELLKSLELLLPSSDPHVAHTILVSAVRLITSAFTLSDITVEPSQAPETDPFEDEA